MPKKTWKKSERIVAKEVGTLRQIGSGSLNRSNRSTSDTEHQTLYIEVKYRAKHTVWSLWEDTRKKAIKEGKVPVVALRQFGRKNTLYLVSKDDILALAEEIKRNEP